MIRRVLALAVVTAIAVLISANAALATDCDVECACPTTCGGSVFDYYCTSCRDGCYINGDVCSFCPGGQYGNNAGGCAVCPTGTYSTQGAADCTQCSPGSYQNLSGQDHCLFCSAGYYQPDAGQASCLQCPGGSYNYNGGQSTCITCPAMNYCPAGSTAPIDCPGGTYCPGGNASPITCPAGSYCPDVGNYTFYQCPAGYYCPTGSSAPTACPVGTYQNLNGSASCNTCPVGAYCPSTASTSPTFCPAGTYQNLTGQTSATACKSCPAGTYQSGTGAGSCNTCPVGYFCSGTGNVAPTSCPAGTYQDQTGQTSCKTCVTGGYCPGGGSAPLACPAGTYQDQTGQTSCKTCTTGHYCSGTGNTAPTSCPAGTYQDQTGQTSCKTCTTGHYCPGGGTTAVTCQAGTYQDQTGQSTCKSCSAGSYQDQTGQTTCKSCPAGTFELSTGSSSCDECPGGAATPCNLNGTCSDGPTGNGTCSCNVGYTGTACDACATGYTGDGITCTPISTTTTTTSTTTTSTTLPPGPCPTKPLSACLGGEPGKSKLLVKSKGPGKDQIKWKLAKGDATAKADFGDPVTDAAAYRFCLYDLDGLLFEAQVDGLGTCGGTPCWQGNGSGFVYKNKAGNDYGVAGAKLKAGDAGKSQVQVKARGLALVPPPMPLPTDGVMAQLSAEDDAGMRCWESYFGTPQKGDTSTYVAKSAPEPICGDGVREVGEDCDDAGESTTCTAECRLKTSEACADGEREGFVNAAARPYIAGCSGGWELPGVLSPQSGAGCTVAGDDSSNPAGTGCGAADLCGVGWHVCTSAAEVALLSADGCVSSTQAGDPGLFFVQSQSGEGDTACAVTGANDLFGCGNIGAPTGFCGVLDRFSHDLCSALPSSWSCGVDGLDEANQVTKTAASDGGVLCCRSNLPF